MPQLWQVTLKDSSKAGFHSSLQTWFEQHKSFLNERRINEEISRSRYTHRKLRSAYLSLKRNLDYLFTFEAHPELDIDNTTTLPDGRFANLKRKLGWHHGIKRENKVKFIKNYFSIKKRAFKIPCQVDSYREIIPSSRPSK